MQERLIRFKEVTKLTSRSRASIYRDIKEGRLPAPIPIGPRAVAWPESQIQQWIDDLIKSAKEAA